MQIVTDLHSPHLKDDDGVPPEDTIHQDRAKKEASDPGLGIQEAKSEVELGVQVGPGGQVNSASTPISGSELLIISRNLCPMRPHLILLADGQQHDENPV